MTIRTSTAPLAPTATLLTVDEAAERLDTAPRFVRRLIAERRIAFHKIGGHVRLLSTDIEDFIAAGRVEPIHRRPRRR